MDEKEHFDRLQKYYQQSKKGYDIALYGAKHFGYYPEGALIKEREAQEIMQDKIAENLSLTNNDLALDAGSGRGVVSVYLAKKYGCSIEGIEVVPFEVDMAKQLAKDNGVAELANYSQMDYSNMDFKNENFDCIYTMETLSHSIDILKTLKEFYRVLKPGGRVALFEYTLAEDSDFSKSELKILKRINKGSAMDGLKDFRHDKFQTIIEKAGFLNVKVENISQNTEPSLARLKKYLNLPYYLFVKPFGLQEKYPNVASAVAFYHMGDKGLIRYNIFTATK